jgi:hypothetical protein
LRDSAKIGRQVIQNDQDDFISARQLVLEWAYQTVHGTLWRMHYGIGLPPELARMITDEDSEYTRAVAEERKQAEPEIFLRLMHAKAPRTVRKLVNQSRWLHGSRLGIVLQEQPERFLAIKAHRRFPKTSPDRQIEYLARTIGAVMVGYRPSTGLSYLARQLKWCEQCGERPAVMELITDGRVYSWCGAC